MCKLSSVIYLYDGYMDGRGRCHFSDIDGDNMV